MSLFIAGTDTGVGKTYVTCALLRACRSAGRLLAPFKPIACGDRADAVALQEAGGPELGLSLDDINPLWLKMPASPLTASLVEGRTIDPAELLRHFNALRGRFADVVVEGVGGWEVPVTKHCRMSDFAAALGLPVIVVVKNQLGALNHTILTVEAVRRRGLECRGLVLNQVADTRDAASISHRQVLEDILQVPVLAELLHGGDEVDPAPFFG